MIELTSLQNPRVKAVARLRDRRGRDKQGRILVDGAREIARAIAGGVEIVEFYFCPSLCTSPDARALVDAPPPAGAVVRTVEQVFERLAFGHRSDGVLAVAVPPERKLAGLSAALAARASGVSRPRPAGGAYPLVAVLDGVEKPGNAGAVLRSADGAGVSAVVLASPGTDLYNPNAIRASLGTIFALPVAAAPREEVLPWLLSLGLRVFAARVDGSIPYADADLRGPTAIVLGSEAEGLGGIWHRPEVTAVRLPMRGIADSLNVSAAAAVLFYECLRQRGDRGASAP